MHIVEDKYPEITCQAKLMVRVRVTDSTDNRGTYKHNVSNIIQYEEPWCITWNHMVCIIRPLGLQNIKGLQRAQKKAEWMTLPKNPTFTNALYRSN